MLIHISGYLVTYVWQYTSDLYTSCEMRNEAFLMFSSILYGSTWSGSVHQSLDKPLLILSCS
jgi:hypothetical protein